MENENNKCNKYEALFVFQNDDVLNEHIKSCPDCMKEYEKQLKVSSLVKEVAPIYLNKIKQKKVSAAKKLACCFVAFIGVTVFSAYKIYDENSFQVNMADEESYISAMGLPVDDYGFLNF